MKAAGEKAMGLRTKFNLVMITAFLIGLAAATFLARKSRRRKPSGRC